ncbi:hypothetical protein LI328DRAFT_126071 [Trichoderma asperelloides]|nr:hypothetical protein LI328DRAFT_126071 [Trichoderma asperelloides]
MSVGQTKSSSMENAMTWLFFLHFFFSHLVCPQKNGRLFFLHFPGGLMSFAAGGGGLSRWLRECVHVRLSCCCD